MAIKLKNGLCAECKDGIPKPIIGKREKALCRAHYNLKLRTRTEPIKKNSDIKIVQLSIYNPVRKVFLSDNKYCVARLENCMISANEVHHTKGRDKYYLDIDTWLPLCQACHCFVETHPEEAKKLFLSQDRLTKSKIVLPFEINLDKTKIKLESYLL